MKKKMKVYEIGYDAFDPMDVGWRIWVAVPEGVNLELLSRSLSVEFKPDMDEKTPGVDILLHSGAAS